MDTDAVAIVAVGAVLIGLIVLLAVIDTVQSARRERREMENARRQYEAFVVQVEATRHFREAMRARDPRRGLRVIRGGRS